MTDEVVRVLNEKFVPFAPRFGEREGYQWWKRIPNADKATALFWLQKQQGGDGFSFWAITAAGQAVPLSNLKKQEGLETLKQVATIYAQLPESQRRPAQPITDANRPEQAPPPGGAVLVIYDQPFLPDGKGDYRRLTGRHNTKISGVGAVPGPQRDMLWLSKEECELLLPSNPRQGQTCTVPSRLTKKIALFGLVPHTAWEAGYQWVADSLRQGDLKLTVEEVSASAVRLRLHGSTLLASKFRPVKGVTPPEGLENRYDARWEGLLEYDPSRKKITRWDMVAWGNYAGLYFPNMVATWTTKLGDLAVTQPIAYGFSFELDPTDYDLHPERRRIPEFLFRFPQYYFDVEKWERDWKKQQQQQR